MQLGRFVLTQPIARGGMGAVWQAREPSLNLDVAVKWAPDLGYRVNTLLEAELRAVATLSHPHIICVYDAGRVTEAEASQPEASALGLHVGGAWFAMELLRPAPLQPASRWEEARGALEAILSALSLSHAHGWIHCDLKPQNLLSDDAGRLSVTDFGVARLARPRGLLSFGGGTPQWMAPEQILGQEWQIGPWTDLFSVGLLAHYLIGGSPPAPEGGLSDLAAFYERPLPPLRPLFEVPPGLVDWVAQLAMRNPARRYRHTALALADLRRLDEDTTVIYTKPTDDSPASEIEAPISRRRLLVPASWRSERREVPPDARYGSGVLRHRLPIVGRAAVQDLLWRELKRAAAGETRIVSVEGEAGVGKSALGSWLAVRADELGIARVFRARAAASHGLIADLLQDALGRLQGAPLSALSALGLPFPEDLLALARGALDPRVPVPAAPRAVAALTTLAEGLPFVLVLDDPSRSPFAQALLWVLLASPHPKLVIVTERQQADLGVDYNARIALEPLELPHMCDLVSRLVPISPDLARQIAEQTEGLPMFAVELVSEWIAGGVLVWDGLVWRLVEGSSLPVPRELLSVLLARLTRALSAASEPASLLRAAQIAAVLGTEVDISVFEEVCFGLGAAPYTQELVAHLSASGVARVDPAREGFFRFSHDLLTEAIVTSAPDPSPIHRAAASAWARRGRRWQERAARHLAALGDREGEIDALCEASAEIRNSDAAAALSLARRALAAARGTHLEARAAAALGDIYELRHDIELLRRLAEEALERLDPESDPATAARLWAMRARAAWFEGDIRALDRSAHRVASLLPRLEPLPRCRLMLRLSAVLMHVRPREALLLSEGARDCAPTLDLAAEARMFRAGYLVDLDRLDEAIAELEFVRPVMSEQGHLIRRSNWHLLYGRALFYKSPLSALPYLLEAIRCRHRLGSRSPWLVTDAMACAVRADRPEIAEEVLATGANIRSPAVERLLSIATAALRGENEAAALDLEEILGDLECSGNDTERLLLALSERPEPLGSVARRAVERARNVAATKRV